MATETLCAGVRGSVGPFVNYGAAVCVTVSGVVSGVHRLAPSHVYHARPTTRTGDARARNVNALGVLSNMLLFVLPLMAIDVEASTLFTGFAPY